MKYDGIEQAVSERRVAASKLLHAEGQLRMAKHRWEEASKAHAKAHARVIDEIKKDANRRAGIRL